MGRFLEKVGWGGQLGGIQNQPGGFEEKCLVTLTIHEQGQPASDKTYFLFLFIFDEILSTFWAFYPFILPFNLDISKVSENILKLYVHLFV